LADGFGLKIERALGRFHVKAHAGRKIAAVGGLAAVAVAFVQMVQIQFGVNAPSDVIFFQKSAGKPGLVFGFVETVEAVEQLRRVIRIAADRFGHKSIELPVVIIEQTQPHAVETIDGVAHRVSGNQPAATEIKRLTTDDDFRAQTAVGDVLIGPGQITLDEIGLVDVGVIDPGTAIGAELPCIQKLGAGA